MNGENFFTQLSRQRAEIAQAMADEGATIDEIRKVQRLIVTKHVLGEVERGRQAELNEGTDSGPDYRWDVVDTFGDKPEKPDDETTT